MANKEVAELTGATALDGTELLHIVQSGNSRKVAVSDLAVGMALPEADWQAGTSTIPGAPSPADMTAAIEALVPPPTPPPTGYNEIGTYVIAGIVTGAATYEVGTLVAGSSLIRANRNTATVAWALNGELSNYVPLQYSYVGIGCTGTWRLMTIAKGKTDVAPLGLFVKVA